MRIPLEERFASKVRVSDSGCHEWIGATRNGYGHFAMPGGPVYAHRVAYELARGTIPDGLDVCHSCDNRRCVNVEHLFVGTRAENMADAKSKGRTTLGERHGLAKLTVESVREIRAMRERGAKYREIAKLFGVSETQAYNVATGRHWGHVQ